MLPIETFSTLATGKERAERWVSLDSKRRLISNRLNSPPESFAAGAAFSVKDGKVYLAKIGNLNPIWSRELPSEPSSVTVIKDCAGRYFLSFVVEIKPGQIDAKNQGIGIDLGIKTFAVMSNGEKAESPPLASWRSPPARKGRLRLATQRQTARLVSCNAN